jgi:uncharacterized membrane protein YfcA
MFAFYFLALLVTFLGTVINLPGSLHINPLLLHFYEPHKVLFLTTFFLVLGALARIIIFWDQILWEDALGLAVYGIIGGMVGGYFVGVIPQKIIVAIFILSGFIYLYKYFAKSNQTKEKSKHYGLFVSGFITAFLQSFGMSVGPLRQGYLFAKGHPLSVVQGTIAVVFLASGVGMLSTRLIHEAIPIHDVLSILVLFPFMLSAVYLGKKVIYKLPKKITDYIIIYSLILSLILAIPYLF